MHAGQPRHEACTSGALKTVNQYSSVSEMGYMPERTPLPQVCLTVSPGMGRPFGIVATPLHMAQLWLSCSIGYCFCPHVSYTYIVQIDA